MWRAFFMALGVTLCILGFECMVLDKAILATRQPGGAISAPLYDAYGFEGDRIGLSPRTIEPPEWAPWSLLSSGAVVLLYALATRGGGE